MATKFPILEKPYITQQIRERTHLSNDIINLTLNTYYDVLYEALTAGFEVKIPRVGRFSFIDVKPKPAGERWHGTLKKRVYLLAKRGFYRITFKPLTKFKYELRGNTTYGEGASPEELEQWVKDFYGQDTVIRHNDRIESQEDGSDVG